MIKKAIILAAGMGTRLRPRTDDTHKCLTEVNGTTIIENALEVLEKSGIKETILVVGYLGNQIKERIGQQYGNMSVSYIENKFFESTSTSYSLFKGLELLQDYDEVFILEGDVIFEADILSELALIGFSNVTVVNKYEPHLDGSFVEINEDKFVIDWIHKNMRKDDFIVEDKYKTVNIYKFSKDFIKQLLFPELHSNIILGVRNEPLENVMMRIVQKDKQIIWGLDVTGRRWAEVDDEADLLYAEKIFM